MNGVEILTQEIIYNTILPEWCIPLGFFLTFVFTIVAVLAFLDEHNILGCICFVMMFVSITVGCLGATKSKTDIHHIEYKVIIDESVSMVEFLGKYEIIDEDGKIYTVIERE